MKQFFMSHKNNDGGFEDSVLQKVANEQNQRIISETEEEIKRYAARKGEAYIPPKKGDYAHLYEN